MGRGFWLVAALPIITRQSSKSGEGPLVARTSGKACGVDSKSLRFLGRPRLASVPSLNPDVRRLDRATVLRHGKLRIAALFPHP